MGKRVVSFFCVYIVLSLLLTGWLMNVTFSEQYITAGSKQSSYTLTVYSTRGSIYDRNMNILAGGASEYKAIVKPTSETTARLMSYFNSDTLEGLEEKIRSGRPFIVSVEDRAIESDGIEVIKCVKRYSSEPIAPHIVGYLDSAGNGSFGIERAYNELLESFEGSYKVTYQVNALGGSLGTDTVIKDTTANSAGGVVLTIDSAIQIIAQKAAEEYLNSGVVVIMEPSTGEILACVSTPGFKQDSISDYLDSEDSPLVNKAFSSYDVGSVFKLVVASAALENGFGDFTHTCNGSIEIGNKTFKCSSTNGHGELNMEQALAHSCNTYFIALAQDMGYEEILKKAQLMGFGSALELGTGYYTGSGNLPDEDELSLPAGLANFSFGQGSLMANPIQIAALISCIANGGEYVYPYIVKETVNSNLKTVSRWNQAPSYRAMDEATAQKLQEYMKACMIYGTGKSVASQRVSTAAKTGSAETGITKDGRQVTRGWFAGYFPADDPQFVCVVLEEDAVSGTVSAGPCFKFLAERLNAIYGK